jgi:hypothetical protein
VILSYDGQQIVLLLSMGYKAGVRDLLMAWAISGLVRVVIYDQQFEN